MKYYKDLEEKEIEEIGNCLQEGKIVVFPTETVYGIGTNVYNEEACKKIYEIKNRPNWKALIILIYDETMLEELVEKPNDIEKQLMNRFWPGALTIILNKKKDVKIPNIVSAGQGTLGIRMTDGKIIRSILEKSKVPVVAPSANLSGKSDGSNIEVIKEELGEQVDIIIDVGNITTPIPSTIVKVIDGKIKVLREGKITNEQLSEIADLY